VRWRPASVARAVGATAAGFVAGAVVMLALQSPAVEPPPGGGRTGRDGGGQEPTTLPPVTPEEPETFLAWVPGGLPEGFGEALDRIPGMRRSVIVRSGVGWLARSFSSQGELVDEAAKGLGYPLEVAVVPPGGYAPFLPPGDRGVIVPLADGEAVLGESSARLRGLGPGATLEFRRPDGRPGVVRIGVAAVLPDELVGAHEVMVSYAVGLRLGIRLDRYALLHPAERIQSDLADRILAATPGDLLLRTRAPGETRYFRQGDAILPPIRLKELFGEFAGRPVADGYIESEAAWVRRNILTERVPILGEVTCHRALFPQLRAALADAVRRGLAGTIDPSHYGGCYASRFVNRIPVLGISHHAWGIAIDVNVAENPYGAPPNQDPRLVAAFRRHGFLWGGDWLLPDGMHFEFGRFP
jgi:D-alanyl-D-alanine carboxypeptidase